MRALISIMLAASVIGLAAPQAAAAQGIVGRVKDAAKKKAEDRAKQTEEKVVEQTETAVDSAMAPAADKIDDAITAAGTAAASIPGRATQALRGGPGGAAEAQRIREELATGRSVLPGIAFLPGSAELAPGAESKLTSLASSMKELGGSFLIEAYVEPHTASEQAQALSAARAATVKAWLLENGIAQGSLFGMGRGGAGPSEAGPGQARIEVARMQ